MVVQIFYPTMYKKHITNFLTSQTQKEPQKCNSEALCCLKGGGYLLSRIALQYHRRKQA